MGGCCRFATCADSFEVEDPLERCASRSAHYERSHIGGVEANARPGGCFKAKMTFPPNYPLYPPKMKFETPIFHPNGELLKFAYSILRSNNVLVYENGEVCISILHPPEDDQYGYEKASERWSPVLSPETVILSVISMLGSPNDESAANIEAGKLWREDQKEFKRKVRRCVRDSMESAWD